MRVLVAYKTSTKTRYERDPNLEDVAKQRRLVEAHKAHHRSLEQVTSELDRRGLSYVQKARADVGLDDMDVDLAISVGGDGMVLDLSHKVGDVPILGVNSDPTNSVGYFCATDGDDFAAALDRIASEAPDELCRFQIAINGTKVGFPILNDVLVAHENPAAVSSYTLQVNETLEVQKSSGIWISTAAGSTAAIRSAGGYVMPITSHRVQYLVREPYPFRDVRYRMLKGFLHDTNRVEVVSRMPNGRVYLDGPHETVSFGVGDVLSVERDVAPLKIFGVSQKTRL